MDTYRIYSGVFILEGLCRHFTKKSVIYVNFQIMLCNIKNLF